MSRGVALSTTSEIDRSDYFRQYELWHFRSIKIYMYMYVLHDSPCSETKRAAENPPETVYVLVRYVVSSQPPICVIYLRVPGKIVPLPRMKG